MLSFAPLWITMKKQGINKEALTNDFGISKSVVSRLNHNLAVSSNTLNYLCTILNCPINEIIEFQVTEEDASYLKSRKESAKK